MYTRQFQYRIDQLEKIKKIIDEYVVGVSFEQIKTNHNVSSRYLSYIIRNYIDPKHRRKPAFTRRTVND